MHVSNTTPYAWPYDGALRPDRCALVICGSGPVWSERCPFDAAVEANIRRLRCTAADLGVLVVLVRHRQLPRAEIGSPEATPPLAAEPGEIEVRAAGTDGFYGSPLDSELRFAGRDQLLFVGRGFECTVHSTLRRANDRGYECLAVADACASLDPNLLAASISTIEMSGGIFGAVGATDNVLNALAATQSEKSS